MSTQAEGAGRPLTPPHPRPGSAPHCPQALFPLLDRTGLTLGSQLPPCSTEQATGRGVSCEPGPVSGSMAGKGGCDATGPLNTHSREFLAALTIQDTLSAST